MKGAAFRWIFCSALVILAHGAAWFAIAHSPPVVDSEAGAPVVMLELAPISAAPASEPEPQPAQPDVEPPPPPVAQAEPPPPAPSPEPTPEPPPPPVAQAEPPPPPPPSPEPTPEPPPPPVAQAQPTPEPPPPPPPSPEPPPEPPPPPPVAQAEPTPNPSTEPPKPTEVQTEAPVPLVSAPSEPAAATAETSAAPSTVPGREASEVSPAALLSWQRELIAQIERHKRFPTGAKGRSGVVRVAFRIDRGGRLTDVHLVDSSGSTALDDAAVALIRASQPFPVPPAALKDDDLSFLAPVRYMKPAKP